MACLGILYPFPSACQQQPRTASPQKSPTAHLSQDHETCHISNRGSNDTPTSTSSSLELLPLATPSRRSISLAALIAGGMPAWFASPPCASASKLPGFADQAWEKLGGGPADLTYPEPLFGTWDVDSVLIKVETPLGEEFVPDINIVNRAKAEDLNRRVQYQARFIKNSRGEVICDRAFNVASLLSYYYNRPVSEYLARATWNPDDPNVLSLNLQGGLSVRMRVTRRSESFPDPNRVETSEYFEQIYDTSNASEPQGPAGVKVKASQCFTKYKWRKDADTTPGQPGIVATQVVSDFLTPANTSDTKLLLQAMNNPIVTYTYRMAFTRASPT